MKMVAFMEDKYLNSFRLVCLPFEPLILHPLRIAVVAAIFLVGYGALRSTNRPRAWTLLVASAAWALWVPWEAYSKAMGYNIRVDLLFLCPLLLIVTLWALIATLWPRSKTTAPPSASRFIMR